MDEWSPRGDSPAAIEDELDHLARIAKQLAANEPPQRKQTPPAPPPGISRRDLDAALESLGAMFGKAVRELVVAPLVKRIAELEAERGLKYVGPWKLGGDYSAGEFVSYGGGIWHCKQATGTRPSKCHEAWTLAVKSGEARR